MPNFSLLSEGSPAMEAPKIPNSLKFADLPQRGDSLPTRVDFGKELHIIDALLRSHHKIIAGL